MLQIVYENQVHNRVEGKRGPIERWVDYLTRKETHIKQDSVVDRARTDATGAPWSTSALIEAIRIISSKMMESGFTPLDVRPTMDGLVPVSHIKQQQAEFDKLQLPSHPRHEMDSYYDTVMADLAYVKGNMVVSLVSDTYDRGDVYIMFKSFWEWKEQNYNWNNVEVLLRMPLNVYMLYNGYRGVDQTTRQKLQDKVLELDQHYSKGQVENDTLFRKHLTSLAVDMYVATFDNMLGEAFRRMQQKQRKDAKEF